MTFPVAEGTRVEYAATPPELQRWVADTLRSPVTSAATQRGGFSPGVATRLTCADGSRAFLKAVPATRAAAAAVGDGPVRPTVNAFAVAALRRETQITAALPDLVSAPKVLASAELDGWVAMLLQDVPGVHPRLPWTIPELRRVIQASDGWHEATAGHSIAGIQPLADPNDEDFHGWRLLAADPAALGRTNPMVRRHLDELVDLEVGCLDAMTGDDLLHVDTRADNLLLTKDRVWFVDWPHAATGAAFVDLATFAPSVAMQGGPLPDDLFAMSRIGRATPTEQLLPVVCALAGYFVRSGLLPAPVGLPTVRAFQAAQGEVALRWLWSLTGWR